MIKPENRIIGRRCKEFRESLGFLQSHVAADTGYHESTISSFETGRDKNMYILLWYLDHGMTINQIRGK